MRLFHCVPLLAANSGTAVAGRLSFAVAFDAVPEGRVSAGRVCHRSRSGKLASHADWVPEPMV